MFFLINLFFFNTLIIYLINYRLSFRKKNLQKEFMSIEKLLQKFGELPTPFYYYDVDLLEETLNIATINAQKYNIKLHFALKANSNPVILNLIRKYGFGADCVSGNEIKRALESGFEAQKIVFAGVGKTDHEISYAIDNQIACFNCESLQEIEIINEIAMQKAVKANIALRINPNVDAQTHSYITTGLPGNKFGISIEELQQFEILLPELTNIKLTGLHFHIGSQILDLNVFRKLCVAVNQIYEWFAERNISLKHINLGGGLGINYQQPETYPIPAFTEYFDIIATFLKRPENVEIHLEPGRSIVGQCGSLITKVMYVKKSGNKNFVIVDAGFTELLRPALYQSYHKIENISNTNGEMIADIVGPICESTDFFAKEIQLSETKRGDLIRIYSAGAYGEAMASNYNLRSTVKAYFSKETFEQK